jgi:hypothetical protein
MSRGDSAIKSCNEILLSSSFLACAAPGAPRAPKLRLFLLLLLILAGCASRTDEVLPLSRSIIGASNVREVEVVVQPPARAAVAALDQKAGENVGEGGYRASPLAQMLPQMIAEATRRAGLTSGRALKLLLEIDDLQTASAGAAMFGKEDRLAGTVFVRDADTGQALGQLYVDVVGSNSGLMGLATRGGVRERLAEGFAARIVKALSGR